MKLPNGERAVVDIVKLSDYCLNPDHPHAAAELDRLRDEASEKR